MTEPRATINIDEIRLEESAEGTRFAAASGEFGVLLGLYGLGAALYVVPAGKTATPFHRHHTSDEMFFILSGNGVYRYAIFKNCLWRENYNRKAYKSGKSRSLFKDTYYSSSTGSNTSGNCKDRSRTK